MQFYQDELQKRFCVIGWCAKEIHRLGPMNLKIYSLVRNPPDCDSTADKVLRLLPKLSLRYPSHMSVCTGNRSGRTVGSGWFPTWWGGATGSLPRTSLASASRTSSSIFGPTTSASIRKGIRRMDIVCKIEKGTKMGTVLRIRDAYPGSEFFYPGSASNSILTQKIDF